MSQRKTPSLLLFFTSFGLCFAAAGIGTYFTTPSITTWYSALVKPSFNPPNWIFGPVWTLLYSMMAFALYLVWTSPDTHHKRKQGEIYFYTQLICNVLWSILFFGAHSPPAALGVIVALWIYIFLSFRSFIHINKYAGWLLAPYLLWVTFAACLNLFIVLLN